MSAELEKLDALARRWERLLLLQLLLLILWVASMLYRVAIAGCVP